MSDPWQTICEVQTSNGEVMTMQTENEMVRALEEARAMRELGSTVPEFSFRERRRVRDEFWNRVTSVCIDLDKNGQLNEETARDAGIQVASKFLDDGLGRMPFLARLLEIFLPLIIKWITDSKAK